MANKYKVLINKGVDTEEIEIDTDNEQDAKKGVAIKIR